MIAKKVRDGMENRFELVMTEVFHDEKDIWHLQVSVLRDRQTGIMYLTRSDGTAGGITPLLDEHSVPMSQK